LIKAIAGALSSTLSQYPLSPDLEQTIQAYLDKHNDNDEYDIQRLHEELLTIHATKVGSQPERHATFLAILKSLRPALNGVERLTLWWDILIGPTLDSLSSTKNTIADARAIVLSLLIYDEDEDTNGEFAKVSEAFTKKLFEVYLHKTKTVPSLSSDTRAAVEEQERQRFVCNNIEAVLLHFGRRKPKVCNTPYPAPYR